MRPTPTIVFSPGVFRGKSVHFRTGHVIIKVYSQDASERAVRSVLDEVMGKISFQIVGKSVGRWSYLSLNTDTDILTLVEHLKGDKRVQYVEPDLKMTGSAEVRDPGDPLLYDDESPQQWGIGRINLFDVWKTQRGNDSVLIGLIDSGLQLKTENEDNLTLHDSLTDIIDHIDFDGSRFITGNNFLYEPPKPWPHEDPDYSYVHGTNMAGILAAWENNTDENGDFIGIAGVNWRSPVYISVAIDSGNNSTIGLVFLATYEILSFAADTDGKPNVVINLSANYVDIPLEDSSAPGPPGQPVLIEDPPPSGDPDVPGDSEGPVIPADPMDTMNEMFGMIVEAGAIICISSGKGSLDPDGTLIQHPAKLGVETEIYASHVIAVGAIDREWKIYEHSGRGIDDMVFAPGVNVGTTDKNNGWGLEDGASIATAHVSGLASLLWSEDPTLTAAKVVRAIKETCQFPPEAESGSNAESEFLSLGVVDAKAALQKVRDWGSS